ncbi:MAG: glycosyltransferase family 2 protein [Solirubrobacteraceae bacterium]|nr:glycosyltransferase family 2 protein [Solirubrobacteraceae bacterium]
MPDLSVLIVNTQSRELLLRCLDAVQRELATGDWDAEVLVVDNASTDGSVGAAEAHPLHPEVIALRHRQGKAASDRLLLERAAGRYGLLLNEDAELQPGALSTLIAALDQHPLAAAVGAKLLRPDGTPQASAWAFPSVRGALWAAVGRPGRVVQSTGDELRSVDWAQSAALLVRVQAALGVDTFDPEFFVYSDEVDFERRLRDAGHEVLWAPDAVVVHHEQLSTDLERSQRRIVEFHRGRDRYLRKHHTRTSRILITWLTAWTYALRAAAATVLPGHEPARYAAHVRAALHPERGEGLSEAAEAFNANRR